MASATLTYRKSGVNIDLADKLEDIPGEASF